MFAVQPVIHFRIEELATKRQVSDMAESGEKRIGETDRLSAHLIRVLEVGEEEEFVFLERAAQVDARIAPNEEGINQPRAQVRIVETGVKR
ncbi:MAG: hypothetical protein ACRD82_21685, partial [Blastocatellia bacterium]